MIAEVFVMEVALTVVIIGGIVSGAGNVIAVSFIHA